MSGQTVIPAPGRKRSQAIGLALVICTAVGWGLNWPATKMLLSHCPPVSARGATGIFASLILFGTAVYRGEPLIVPAPLRGRLVLAALLNVTIWMGGTTTSMLWLSSGKAATLAYTMPAWAVLLGWPILQERPGIKQSAAVLMGICGVVVVVLGSHIDINRNELPGVALALFAAGSFAFSTVWSKRRAIGLPPMVLTAWQIGIGSVPLLLGGLLLEHPDFSRIQGLDWLVLGYTAVVSMGLCYLAWFAAVRRLSASTAALGTLLTPVIGVSASIFVVGDPLTTTQGLSLALVVGGIVLALPK